MAWGTGDRAGTAMFISKKEETNFNFGENFVLLKLLLAYTQQKFCMNYSYMQFISMHSTDLHAHTKSCSLSYLRRPSWIKLFDMRGRSFVFMQLLMLVIHCTISYCILGGLEVSMPALVPDVNVQKLEA